MNKTLKRKLDDIFSKYIRLRDSNENGIFRCISCGKPVSWKNGDNGHFVNRQHMSLRYSEVNCNAQCRHCNRFDEGNNIGYQRGLIEKYGDEIINELEIAKYRSNSISDVEARIMINYYKQEVAKLLKEKNLKK